MFLATDAQIHTDFPQREIIRVIGGNLCICGYFMSIQQNCSDAWKNMDSITFLFKE